MNRYTTVWRHMTPAGRLGSVVAAIAVVALLLAVIIRATSPDRATPLRLVGSPAPSFSLHAENRGEVLPGKISLASERGGPILLVFMFSLCPHCLNQIEAVKSLSDQAPSGSLHILYIDSPAESPGIISAYAERLVIETPATPILLDPGGALARQYGVYYYPATFLIDGKGIVRGVWTGETGVDSLQSAIRVLSVSGPAPGERRRL